MFPLFLFALAKITHPNVDDDTCRRLPAAWSIALCFIAMDDESLRRGLATIESESSIVVGRLIPKFIELIVLLLPISLRLNSKSFTQTDLVMFPEKNLKNLVNAEKNEREKRGREKFGVIWYFIWPKRRICIIIIVDRGRTLSENCARFTIIVPRRPSLPLSRGHFDDAQFSSLTIIKSINRYVS